MVELRTSGYVEVNGLADAGDFSAQLDQFLRSQWNCTDYKKYLFESSEKYCDKKYTTDEKLFYLNRLANNLGKMSIKLADFAGSHGWSLLLANGGSITPNPFQRPNHIVREQQLKFTKSPKDAQRPLLMIEMRIEPCGLMPYPCWNGYVEINGKNTGGIYEKLDSFITKHMKGRQCGRQVYCDMLYATPVFRMKEHSTRNNRWDGRMNGESNIGQWTMRLCDFMVDHLGEWDMVTCDSDNVDWSFYWHHRGKERVTQSVTGREMQMVFRHQPRGGKVFMSAPSSKVLGRAPLYAPLYWKESSRQGSVGQEIVPGSREELAWMQALLDGTFKKKRTRDRKGALAERFVAVSCLRSENPALWDTFAQQRQKVLKSRGEQSGSELVFPRTIDACPELAERCTFRGSNPTVQAYMMHGTSPTSAVSLLSTAFKVDLAGKSAGCMFGPGIYLAEASSKADEYARDDAGGTYDGLFAIVVCRAVIGRPFVTLDPGNHAHKVTSGEYDVVIGDREKAVGTYREFVFFNEASVYPEYAVFYRREFTRDSSSGATPTPHARRVSAPAAATYAPALATEPARKVSAPATATHAPRSVTAPPLRPSMIGSKAGRVQPISD